MNKDTNLDDILNQLSRPVEELAKEAGVAKENIGEFVEEGVHDKHTEIVVSDVRLSVAAKVAPIKKNALSGNVNEEFLETLINDLKAATNQELVDIGKLIEKSGNVNIKNSKGETGLHIACTFSKHYTENFLLASADPNIRNNSGLSALHLIITTPIDKSIIELLLIFGADPCLRDNHGRTPIHLVHGSQLETLELLKSSKIYRDNLEELYKIFEDRGKPQYAKVLKAMDNDLETLHFGNPILFTFVDEDKDIVKALIKVGVNVNHCSSEGISPLMYAANTGSYISAQFLLEANADIECRDKDGNRASDIAKKKGQDMILVMINEKYLTPDFLKKIEDAGFAEFADLMEHERDINVRKHVHGTTIMHELAKSEKYIKLLEECIYFGASPNVGSTEVLQTPLMIAANTGNYSGAELMLKSGANPNFKAMAQGATGSILVKEGMDAAQIAEISGNYDVADLIRGWPTYKKESIFAKIRKGIHITK